MGIVNEDVERVRGATDLIALVSEHVALRRVGTRWSGICPFHAEKTGSFSVNGELGLYYCFGCQARGDAISFLRETEHLDFVTAVEALAGRAGIQLRYDREERGSPGGKRATELAKSLEQAVDWYHERLLGAPDGAPARRYLRGRGYDSQMVKHFRLGWAPAGWDTLVRGVGVTEEMLLGAGLAYRNQAGRLNDSFRARGCCSRSSMSRAGPSGLGGRILPGVDGPKYKNTQATPLYDKSKVLYGLNWAKGSIVERGQVVVCEGYTDVIGLHQAGVTEAVATCGTALAEGHVRLLTGFSRRIILAYDADSAGRGAAERFYDWESRFEADISVVALPAGADPADLAKEDPLRLREAVANARPYLGFRLERLFADADLRNPEGRARAAEAAMALISEHPDTLVRDQYLMQVSDRCRLSPEQLRSLSHRATGHLLTHLRLLAPFLRPNVTSHRCHGPSLRHCALWSTTRRKWRAGSTSLFSSDLAKAAFEELASAMTFPRPSRRRPPEVADLLGQLAVEDSVEEPGRCRAPACRARLRLGPWRSCAERPGARRHR